MSKIIISQFFAFAFAIFIFPVNALPLPNGDLQDSGIIDKMAILIAPFSEWLAKKSPEFIDQMFKDVLSPDALKKTTDTLHKDIQDTINKEIPKLPKYIQKAKEEFPIQLYHLYPLIEKLLNLQMVKKLEKAVEKLGSQTKSSGILNLPEEPLKTGNTKIETPHLIPEQRKTGELMGVDEKTPYEQINDWAMKQLGYANTDGNSYIPDYPDVNFDDLPQVPDTHNNIEEDDDDGPIKTLESVSPLKSTDEKDDLSKMVDSIE